MVREDKIANLAMGSEEPRPVEQDEVKLPGVIGVLDNLQPTEGDHVPETVHPLQSLAPGPLNISHASPPPYEGGF